MAFPTIPTVAAGRVLSALATNPAGTHTSPNLSSLTKNAGDLLIAIVIIYDGNSTNAEFSSWGGGFTEFKDQATTTTMGIGCAYKWSDGTETGTFTVTSADTSANDSAFFLLSIAGANSITPPEAGDIANGTAAAADPGSFNPAGWGAEDTLWIAVAGSGETSTTGSFTGVASAPANYGNYADSGISADVVGGVEGAVAFRQLNAASEDVGTFSVDVSNARNSALLIAVRPVVDGVLAGTSTASFSAGSSALTGAGALAGSGTMTFTPSATMAGDGALAGASTATFTVSGTAEDAAPPAGDIAGTSTMSFAPAGALSGDGALVGSSTASFTGTASVSGDGALAGASLVAFAPSGAALADGALLGSGTISFSPSATMGGDGALSGASNVVFTPGAAISATAELLGAATVSFSGSGTVTSEGILAGSLTVAINPAATLSGVQTFPNPGDVRTGVQYGPSGTEYTGVMAGGGGGYMRRR